MYKEVGMEKIIKPLIFLLIIVHAISIGCAPKNVKLKAEERARFNFIDSSNGLPSSGQWRHGMAFCDINLDGYIDIAAPPPRKASNGQKMPFVWYGNGGKAWRESRLNLPPEIAYDYGGISVCDLDGDTIVDMALAMHGQGLKVLKGEGQERYTDLSENLPPKDEFKSRALVCADFDNDGIPEIAAVSEAKFGADSQPSGVWTCHRRDNTWRCSPIGDREDVLGFYADQLVVGDVNGDGNKDIAVASLVHVRDLIVWLGDGRGSFRPFNVGLPRERHYLSVALGDVDRDGWDDLVASISWIGDSPKGLRVFLSRPDGFEEMSEGLPANELFTAVGVCDLDEDGSVELIGATGVGLKIFSQKGSGWAEASASGLPEEGLSRIYNVYCIDLNGDGYKDIAINYARDKDNSGGIRVFLNVPFEEP
jgi:hypothetical protein